MYNISLTTYMYWINITLLAHRCYHTFDAMNYTNIHIQHSHTVPISSGMFQHGRYKHCRRCRTISMIEEMKVTSNKSKIISGANDHGTPVPTLNRNGVTPTTLSWLEDAKARKTPAVYYHGSILAPAWIRYCVIVKWEVNLLIHSQTSTVQPLTFGNW